MFKNAALFLYELLLQHWQYILDEHKEPHLIYFHLTEEYIRPVFLVNVLSSNLCICVRYICFSFKKSTKGFQISKPAT